MPVKYRIDRGKFAASFTYKKIQYFAGHHATEAEAQAALQRKQDEVATELGVDTVKRTRRPFQAEIIVNGKKIYIGSYATREEARAAYENKKSEVQARTAEREKQQELETPGHGPGKVPLRNKDGTIVEWAIVDLEDEARVREQRWYLEIVSDQLKYAGGRDIRLHTFVMGITQAGYVIDHIDGNGLNNCKNNLRKVNATSNCLNTNRKCGKTGYRGVRKLGQRYYCRVHCLFDIGFQSAIEAAQHYDRIMLMLHGPLAKTNDVLPETEKRILLEQYRVVGPQFFAIENQGASYIVQGSKSVYETFDEALYEFQKSKRDSELVNYQNNMQKRRDNFNSEITYNDDGDAIIDLRNKGGAVIALAIVDDEIWPEAALHGWYLDNSGYVAAMTDLGRIRLHNYVWKKLKGEIPSDQVVDHILNGVNNRTNCKLSNLRLNTRTGNSHNRSSSSESGFKGVQKAKSGNFKAKIQYEGKQLYIGTFSSAEGAARAYDKMALKLHGEGACCNFHYLVIWQTRLLRLLHTRSQANLQQSLSYQLVCLCTIVHIVTRAPIDFSSNRQALYNQSVRIQRRGTIVESCLGSDWILRPALRNDICFSCPW